MRMPKDDTLPHNLRKKEIVRAAINLRGVPEGTMGRVILSSGLDWVRYWVAFDNGVEVGSLHRNKLVREAEWMRTLCSVSAVRKSLKVALKLQILRQNLTRRVQGQEELK